MEQVAENHGDGLRDIYVTCVDGLRRNPPDVHPPRTFREFYDFPEICGWQVKDDFTIAPNNSSTQVETGRSRVSEPMRQAKQLSKPFLVQAWLFFGLVQTVIQIDNRPILSFTDLHNPQGQLSTAKLHEAIETWTKWESRNQEGQRFRMIQVGWVLDLARQVVRKEYAYYPGENDDADDETDEDRRKQEQVHPGDRTVLVIMCLGETLSAAKARIVKQNKVNTTGWHSDEQAGWGPPKCVFEMMEKDEWCPRTIEILRGQVGSNATMFVAAWQAYKDSKRMKSGHQGAGCTPQECKLKSQDENGDYMNRHRPDCKKLHCEPVGPPEDEILAILGEDDNVIPLLELVDDMKGGPQVLKVTRFCPGDPQPAGGFKFVTVSHVWSDGWGNETENKLNRCQLEFISRQILKANENKPAPFWMDTLVIPVAKGQENCRKKGIRQIFDVFSRSSHTIVLDNGLSDMDRGNATRPAEAAMKIFASIWMRRLWTLQEAYLSNRLLIPFIEENKHAYNLVDFDDLERDLEILQGEPKSGIIQMIKVQLSRTIMGEERRSNNAAGNKERHEKLLEKKAAVVVANAYRAARWRTTAKAEHEVLALATLLNLEIKDTKIEEAGLDPPLDDPNPSEQNQPLVKTTKPRPPKGDPSRLEDLVCEFWELLHKQRKGAIPSGMIFLPGEKVNRKGFGWAPRTWLSAYEMDYPDPLSSWNKLTELSPEKGLSVHYPGFLLHPDSTSSRSRILGTSIDPEPFTFPVDRSLNEWYSFQRLEDSPKGPLDEVTRQGPLNELTRQRQAKTQLAIILSGSSLPRESPKEVALLVEVIDTETARTSEETLDTVAVEYRCSIIHRVLVWRNPDHLRDINDKRNFKSGYPAGGSNDHICIGEVTSSMQRWWVDRPVVVPVVDKTESLLVDKTAADDFIPKPLTRPPTYLEAATNAAKGITKGIFGLWRGGRRV